MKLPLASMGVPVLALVLGVMRTADAAVGGRLGSVFSTPQAGKRQVEYQSKILSYGVLQSR